ncbi:MAG: O-antigen ligase family protein [Sulfuricaulis sp.]
MKKLKIVGLTILGLLFFVWPVAHTVSVRDLLLVLNLVVFGRLAWTHGGSRAALRGLAIPVSLLVGLTAWMYFVAFFISSEMTWSLHEIASQWVRGLAALLIGAFVALSARQNPRFTHAVLAVLLGVLALHILSVDYQAARGLLASGPLGRMAGLTDGPDKSSYLTNLLFGLLLAELFFRVSYHQRVLPLSPAVLAAALALAAVSVIAERTRNGMIMLLLMLLLLAGIYWRERRDRISQLALAVGSIAMIVVALGGVALVASARQSSSLAGLIDTVPIAWDTKHHKVWRDVAQNSWPKLPNGTTVDVSVYERIAWLKEGLLLVRDHPLGIGFGRDAFGHGLQAKYGEGSGHSHSGLLDMAIGLGIPGALLWLGFFTSLARAAWRYRRAGANYAALLLLLWLTDYGGRMLLDSVIRDHMLQQFMFLTALAAVWMTDLDPEQGKSRA